MTLANYQLKDYSPGIQLGLVAVSASRSRPYPQAAGGGSGRKTAACLLVSLGLGRMDGRSRGAPAGVVRARDRHPDGPRPGVTGLGSAGQHSAASQSSLHRGLGPGRGLFGRGAPNLSRYAASGTRVAPGDDGLARTDGMWCCGTSERIGPAQDRSIRLRLHSRRQRPSAIQGPGHPVGSDAAGDL